MSLNFEDEYDNTFVDEENEFFHDDFDRQNEANDDEGIVEDS